MTSRDERGLGPGGAYNLNRATFAEYGGQYRCVPLALHIPYSENMDPSLLYGSLRKELSGFFLFESAPESPLGGRSFLGFAPEKFIEESPTHPLLDHLRETLIQRRPAPVAGLPPFLPILGGYLGSGMAAAWETLFHNAPHRQLQRSDLPDALIGAPTLLITLGRHDPHLVLLDLSPIPEGCSFSQREAIFDERTGRLATIARKCRESADRIPHLEQGPGLRGTLESRPTPEEYRQRVLQAQEYILRGEVYQIVPSREISASYEADPLETYRALREENPAPYLFLLEFPQCALIGSSPEMLLRSRGRHVTIRPLAGTRSRGATTEQDLALEADLICDPKEQAEHVMLVDLARNDLGRVCIPGSVVVTSFQRPERFSRVMHLASQVEGILRPECDSLDALRSAFPAGTLSGAPKIRALELIDDLEDGARGPYGGAIVFFSPEGDVESCIAIRTLVQTPGHIAFRVGAGVVFDSSPEGELMETEHKGQALVRALERVGRKLS